MRDVLNSFGYDLHVKASVDTRFPPDIDEAERDAIAEILPFTMTGSGQLASLRDAVRYIESAGIPGDIVECGVWRGGSSMAMATMLRSLGSTTRHLYLFDTFAGMAEPGPEDVSFNAARAGEARSAWQSGQRADGANDYCFASLEDVEQNLRSTGYPADRVHLVKGMVEDTIPAAAPDRIAILRLDTDWYASTKHELEHLWPRLSVGGVIIIDDYGCWQGARKATDEYFASRGIQLFLERHGIPEARSAIKR